MADPASTPPSPQSSRGHVLITGASTGIGQACVLHLAELGFHVFAGVRRDVDAQTLREAAQKIRQSDAICPIHIDVTDAAAIATAAQTITEKVANSGLAALVNNAGISVSGPIELVKLEDWRRQFEVNFFGPIAVTQAFLPLLRRRIATAGPGSARIVMMSSVAGKIAQPIAAPYTASKFALESLSDSLRMELRSQGIPVSIVEPGAIATPLWNKGIDSVQTLDDESARQNYGQLVQNVRVAVERVAAGAIPPAAVAAAVANCLTARRPPIRCTVGKDAKAGVLSRRFLPDWAFDLALRRFYKLP